MPSMIQMETVSRELFECLMNRIYNVDDFVRMAGPSARERTAIDAWLETREELNVRTNNNDDTV